jgi:[ribosomal protein S18]-alanine N-acetyltransferase
MRTNPVTIRSLGYSHLPQVIAIERRAFPTAWSLAMFVLELSKPSGVCLAAMEHLDDGGKRESGEAAGASSRGRLERVVGYLICSRYADVWHLMNVAVDPAARRRGIATALLGQMLERAGPEDSYTLEVRPSNAVAIALYERFGFRPAGTRRRYYQDTGEDALIMWRTAQATSASSPSA